MKDKVAIRAHGRIHTYSDLHLASENFAQQLLNQSVFEPGARVCFMVSPGFDYVRVQWGIWQAGGVAVPLCISYPLPSLQYVIEDTQSTIVVLSPEYTEVLLPYIQSKNISYIILGEEPSPDKVALPEVKPEQNAMILYTSGTTSLPKGVVSTHANINAQVQALQTAWEWTATDHIICVLPLHHVHGVINVVTCSLRSGATLTFLPSFSAEAVFNEFLHTDINLFMAVPTIYFKLIAYYEAQPEDVRKVLKERMLQFRFMVSGSAALPVSVLEKWQEVSGQTLLERYGMTEIGMAISNPLHGERRPGYIGVPLPNVSVRLVSETGEAVENGQPGLVEIKGPNVFKEYWNKAKATAESFTADGWFKTGDVAILENEYYRILGRDSVDVIKSGGYKISALEIEEVLRTYPKVEDACVVGLPSDEWGEIVAAAIVASDIDHAALNQWMRAQMPAYKTPRKYLVVNTLPRNAMGKVTKNDVKPLFES